MHTGTNSKITARARVQVTVEVDVPDTWGDDCTVSQVHGQATQKAVGLVQSALTGKRIRVVGTPTVEMVTTGAAVITPLTEPAP